MDIFAVSNDKQLLLSSLKIKSYSQKKQQYEKPLEQYIAGMYQELNMKKYPKTHQFFQSENFEGNIEYKLSLINPNENRIEILAKQMKFRIKEGSGEALYRIGVEDNGRPIGLEKTNMIQTLKSICYIASKIRADVTVIAVSEGIQGLIVELMIRQPENQ